MSTLKICRDCKYFKPDTKRWFLKEYAIQYGLCTHKSTTYTNYISGKIIYYEAKEMRDNYDICGKNAKLYVENPNIISKYVAEISGEDLYKFLLIILLIMFIGCMR